MKTLFHIFSAALLCLSLQFSAFEASGAPGKRTGSAAEKRQTVNFLQSENVQDILVGLDRIDILSHREAKPFLLRLANHKNPKVAAKALDILVSRKDPDASPLVRQNIAHSIQPKERLLAIHQLGKLENPADFPFFLRLLDIENQEIRVAVISWIGKLKIPNAILPLTQMLEDSRDIVRAEAVQALAAISKKNAILSIISRLSDPSAVVRKAALAALAPEDIPMARHALLRLLQSGTREERVAVLKLLPGMPEARPYLLDLLRSSKPEEIPSVLPLFSGEIDDETLQEFARLAAQLPMGSLQDLATRIWNANTSILANWILSPGSASSIRIFCGTVLANTNPRLAEETLRRAWRIGYLSGKDLSQVYLSAATPPPLGLMMEIFEQGSLEEQKIILDAMSRRKDDRMGSLLLKKIAENPALEPLLLPYARETQGRIFARPLLARLAKPDNMQQRDILFALREIVDKEHIGELAAAGNALSGDELVVWSDILWRHMDANTPKILDKIVVSSQEMERELSFLALAAAMRGLPLPAHFAGFTLPDNPHLHHLWVFYARNPDLRRIPRGLDNKQKALLLDLLPDGPPPPGLAPQSASPQLVQALARFAWPAPILEAFLESSNPCVRINAARAYAGLSARRQDFLRRRMEHETSPLATVALLRGYRPESEEEAETVIKFCMKNTALCRAQLPAAARNWPEDVRSKMSEWLDEKTPPAAGDARQLIRFHFQALPKNLACIVIASPEDGLRAATAPGENDLVILHLPKTAVSLHPVYP